MYVCILCISSNNIVNTIKIVSLLQGIFFITSGTKGKHINVIHTQIIDNNTHFLAFSLQCRNDAL